MPRGKHLTEFEKGEITALSKQSYSHRQIAKLVNRSKTVITNF